VLIAKEAGMEIGIIGLGRMGMNMARRLLRGGHRVVVSNRTLKKVKEIVKEGAVGAANFEELADFLKPPRSIWIMLPAGPLVDESILRLSAYLGTGDTVIDGGNSYYKDDIRREEQLRKNGIHYMDVGVSGGVWGLEKGFCLMVGGEKNDFERLEPVFETLAPESGYLYCGPCGAGHFVKMVHNGIEYGMMAAYSEGFELLQASPYHGALDMKEIAHLWNQGSVIRSWLLELAENAFRENGDLSLISGYVEDSGEGRWTVQQGVETGVPLPVISAALFQRFRSRKADPLADRLLAALRNQFGGHAVRKK
jgi:6-phosphogluconate dehydrogenase